MNEANNLAVKIISAIEREEISEDVKGYIKQADDYLFGRRDIKPEFIDEFIDKTKAMLISTVNGCIKSRNNPKKKDDLKKYKEGYFNEIIQNANDIVVKTIVKNPTINIRCSKQESKYRVVCTYPDRGFSLMDIYGFCSRGNSNKSSEIGQEGMYGIGIKSLFCFATYFSIENNMKLELTSTDNYLDSIKLQLLRKPSLKQKLLQYKAQTTFKKRKNTGRETLRSVKNVQLIFQTKLILEFEYDTEINNKHAGFNVKKLAEFIEALIVGDKVDRFFLSEEENKIIFDPRSLIFTELRHNRTIDNSIKSIKFFAGDNQVIINVEDKYYQNDISIKSSIINISAVDEKLKYIVFHDPDLINDDNNLSIAYAVDKSWEGLKDRIYATYFVSNYSNLLEKNTGCLVNTRAINSSRSGLERENESEPLILSKIKQLGKSTIDKLIRILDDDCTDENWKKIASDVLCHLLYVYKREQIDEETELMPLGIFKDKKDVLIKLFSNNRLYLVQGINYIYREVENDEINNNQINKNSPQASDDENRKALYKIYIDEFKRKDIILYKDEKYNELSLGIKLLAKELFDNGDEYKKLWVNSIDLPFIRGAKNLISKRLIRTDFDSIMKFINVYNESEKVLIKQLIARFEINKSFDYMGNYSNYNIVNWLFSDSKNNYYDDNYIQACSEYEKSYLDLKKLLEDHIHFTRYYSSDHWNADSDCWYEKFNINRFNNVSINEKHISQFLNLLDKNILKVAYNKDWNHIFIHNLDIRNLMLRNRTRRSEGWNKDILKYVSVDFLDRSILSFDKFKLFRFSIDKFNMREDINDKCKLNFLRYCKIEKAGLNLLQDIFRWLSVYEECIHINIRSLDISSSQDTKMINFLKKFIGNTNIRLEKIEAGKNGAKFIGYITNIGSNCYTIKCRKKADENFTAINYDSLNCKCATDDMKNLIIFYSNSDEQAALSHVLKDMGEKNELSRYIDNFINTDNVKQLSSNDYDKYLKRLEIEHIYPFEKEVVESFLENTNEMSMEEIYTILSGEMSYDDYCPICSSIPTLNIKGDKSGSVNKNCLVTIIPAQYNGQTIYTPIIFCKSCFEEYKVSLTEAMILCTEDNNYLLELKSTICDSSRTYDFVKRIRISPDNWKIVCDFNKNMTIDKK